MLLAFTVENYRSIRTKQTLSLEEPRADQHLEGTNVVEKEGHRLLKTVALYGANASGKSNVLGALEWMRSFILHSVTRGQVGEPIDVTPFRLSTETESKPSHFEIEFLLDGFSFRYGFQVDRKAVRQEWLFRKRPRSKEARLFTREGQSIDVSDEHFKEGRALTGRTRDNALFLSVCAQFNVELAAHLLGWLGQLRTVKAEASRSSQDKLIHLLQDEASMNSVLKIAQQADFAISEVRTAIPIEPDEFMRRFREARARGVPLSADLRLARIQPRVQTLRRKFGPQGEVAGSVEFDLVRDESAGTQKFLLLGAPLQQTLKEGSVFVVDEFDARLHPRLTQAVLDLFHGPANQRGAQLIFAAHDVTLLEPERFRRDQVWFCEKDETGATDLYSLAEFDPKDVRPDTRFSRRYLQGVFGAVPRLADFGEKVAEVLRHE